MGSSQSSRPARSNGSPTLRWRPSASKRRLLRLRTNLYVADRLYPRPVQTGSILDQQRVRIPVRTTSFLAGAHSKGTRCSRLGSQNKQPRRTKRATRARLGPAQGHPPRRRRQQVLRRQIPNRRRWLPTGIPPTVPDPTLPFQAQHRLTQFPAICGPLHCDRLLCRQLRRFPRRLRAQRRRHPQLPRLARDLLRFRAARQTRPPPLPCLFPARLALASTTPT
jgi:hypothetical protein